jgi:hypothetical protein
LGQANRSPWRWKHITDGAEGANKAEAELPKISAIRETSEAHRLFLAVFFAAVRFSVILQNNQPLPCYFL